nr:DNA mismatch repair protein [Raoultella sp. NCTC 9187]
MPFTLKTTKFTNLDPELIGYLAQRNAFDVGDIAQWIARNLASEHAQWNMAQAISVLADVERLCPQLVKSSAGWPVTTR